MKKATYLLIYLNFMDFLFTFVGLQIGYFDEANELLLNMYNNSVLMFVFFKLIFVNLLIFILYLCSYEYKVARIGLVISNIVYSVILISHVVYLFLLFL